MATLGQTQRGEGCTKVSLRWQSWTFLDQFSLEASHNMTSLAVCILEGRPGRPILDRPVTLVMFVLNDPHSPKLNAQLNCLDVPLATKRRNLKVQYHHGMVLARSANIYTSIDSIFFFRSLFFIQIKF